MWLSWLEGLEVAEGPGLFSGNTRIFFKQLYFHLNLLCISFHLNVSVLANNISLTLY